jgi:hypothetical protein
VSQAVKFSSDFVAKTWEMAPVQVAALLACACWPVARASVIDLVNTRLWSEETPGTGGPQWVWQEPVFGPSDFPDGTRVPYVHLDGER